MAAFFHRILERTKYSALSHVEHDYEHDHPQKRRRVFEVWHAEIVSYTSEVEMVLFGVQEFEHLRTIVFEPESVLVRDSKDIILHSIPYQGITTISRQSGKEKDYVVFFLSMDVASRLGTDKLAFLATESFVLKSVAIQRIKQATGRGIAKYMNSRQLQDPRLSLRS